MEARQLDYYDFYDRYEDEKEYKVRKSDERIKRMRKKERANLALLRLFIFFCAVVFFVAGLLVVRGLANINKVQHEIIALENRKKELIQEKSELYTEIEAIKASAEIQDEARFKLGMIYPEEGQVVYVSVGDSSIKGNEKKSFLRFLTLMSKGQ
ncbi:MAG: hypothetical protein GX219_05450 [Tissierellia bacterium]|nr:hypothetical protein [Tissierellia bacterium]